MWEQIQKISLSLDEYEVEGVHSGLLQDIQYRPNRYFQTIEKVERLENTLLIEYKEPIQPLTEDSRFSLSQTLDLVNGILDAKSRLAPLQRFYLAEHPCTFCEDSKKQLRIALLNVRKKTSPPLSEDHRTIEALLDFIAGHSPEAQKKIAGYGKRIKTILHLQQILENSSPQKWIWSLFLLLVVSVLGIASLAVWGPPKLRRAIQNKWTQTKHSGLRFFRTGTDEWYEQLQTDRKKKDFRFSSIPMILVIDIQAQNANEKQRLFVELHKILAKELEGHQYELTIPHPNLSLKAYEKWKRLCDKALEAKCSTDSWLLEVKDYKGGSRPLSQAIQEYFSLKDKKKVAVVHYKQIIGHFVLNYQNKKQEKPSKSLEPLVKKPNPTTSAQ